MGRYAKRPTNFSVAALKTAHQTCSVSATTALLAEKTAQKPLKCTVAQSSGPFFVAHTRSVRAVVAEFCCATLNVSAIPLCYTATVSVVAHFCWRGRPKTSQ
jgi:hypothetical protein